MTRCAQGAAEVSSRVPQQDEESCWWAAGRLRPKQHRVPIERDTGGQFDSR
jgi:hypothetical protein